MAKKTFFPPFRKNFAPFHATDLRALPPRVKFFYQLKICVQAKSFGFSIDFESRLITPYQSDAVSSSFAIPSSTVASSVIPNSFALNEPKQKMLVQGKAFSKTVLQSASALHTNRRPICGEKLPCIKYFSELLLFIKVKILF